MDDRAVVSKVLLEVLADIDPDPILDVGCVGSAYVGSLGQHIGVDWRPYPTISEDCVFHQEDFLTVTLPDESFRLIVMANVTQYLGSASYGVSKSDQAVESGNQFVDAWSALVKAASLLTEDGLFFVSFPIGIPGTHTGPSGQWMTFDESDLDEAMSQIFGHCRSWRFVRRSSNFVPADSGYGDSTRPGFGVPPAVKIFLAEKSPKAPKSLTKSLQVLGMPKVAAFSEIPDRWQAQLEESG